MNKTTLHNFAVLSAVLALIFGITYSVHLDYRFPYHVDEWNHIALAKDIMGEGWIRYNDPYFRDGGSRVTFETGFHLFLAELFLVSSLNPITFYQYLPAFFAVLSGMCLYVLLYKLTGRFWLSVYSLIFFASLRSNINVLGLKFFTPFTFSLPLVFLFLFEYVRGYMHWSRVRLVSAGLLFMGLLICYPLSAFLVLLVSLVFSLLNQGPIKNNFVSVVSALLVLAIIVCASFEMMTGEGDLIGFLKKRIFLPYELGLGKKQYSMLGLYGGLATALAFIGILPGVKNRFTWVFIVWLMLTFSLTFIHNMAGFSIIFPYRRAVYYSLLAMTVLSGLGLEWMINAMSRVLNRVRVSHTKKKIFLATASFLILSAVMYPARPSIHEEKDMRFYKVIDEDGYIVLSWIGGRYGPEHTLLAPRWMSAAATPITGGYIVASVPGTMGGGYKPFYSNFFKKECREQMRLIQYRKIDLIISKKNIQCDEIEKVHKIGGWKIYEVVD